MPDFLERYGEQLRSADLLAIAGSSRRRRAVRRGALASVAVLAIAAPALAIVRPWSPTLGRPGVDGPVTTDRASVAKSARDVVAALRREQTAADRESTAHLLGMLGSQTDRIQTESIRALGPEWALVPVNSVRTGPGRTIDNQLCITNGELIACGASGSVATKGIQLLAADASGTRLYGLVPDAVARVRFTPSDGAAVEARASSNFFQLIAPNRRPPHMIHAPEGSRGPAMVPGPPMPVSGALEWLDANGTVIGPERKRIGQPPGLTAP